MKEYDMKQYGESNELVDKQSKGFFILRLINNIFIIKALETADLLPEIKLKPPKKPDFIKNPHKYFRDRDSIKLSELEKPLPSLAESMYFLFLFFF